MNFPNMVNLPFLFAVLVVTVFQSVTVSQTQEYRLSGNVGFDASATEPALEISFDGTLTLDLNATDLAASDSFLGNFEASMSSLIFDIEYETTRVQLFQYDGRQAIYFIADPVDATNIDFLEFNIFFDAVLSDVNQLQFLDLSNPPVIRGFRAADFENSSSGSAQVVAIPEPSSGVWLMAVMAAVMLKRKKAY